MARELPVLMTSEAPLVEPIERKSFETASTAVKPPPLKRAGSRRGLETQLIKDPTPKRLSLTQIRGVAQIEPTTEPLPAPASLASLRTDRSVLLEMAAFKRDPVWQIEKIGRGTAGVTSRALAQIGEWVESGYRWTATHGISSIIRFFQTASEVTKDAWESSKALAAQNQPRPRESSVSQAFKRCELRTIPARCMLRVRADDAGLIAAELEERDQVIIFPEYAATEGWVLAQKPGGEIGFARIADLSDD